MNRIMCLVAALLLCGCASNEEDERPDAIDDFIQVSDLEEVRVIRSMDTFGQRVLNESYVILTTRKEQYLIAYPSPCPIAYDKRRSPDFRSDARAIYADRDTFRGCRIKAIYPISEAQAAELMEIGRAPGGR